MYQAPTLKFAPYSSIDSSKQDLLILTHAKRGVPAALVSKIPARFVKTHGALKGDRGAKLTIHGDTTVVVMGLGELALFTPQEAAEWGENAGHALNREQVASVQVVFPDELTESDVVENFLKGLCLANYRLEEFKSKKSNGRNELKQILVSGKGVSGFKPAAFERIRAIVSGIVFARSLIELPSGTADPQGICARFKAEADQSIQIEIWDEKKIKAKKMGLIQAVSAGSHVPPRFLIARYGKKSGGKTLFLVGKGVTFDTGGINLKTVAWKDLLWMKKDMGGAAAVLGAMLAIARVKPSINVVAITPLTTNSIGSSAINPGDIFTAMSGKTVEVQNTDAEGRLVLADALHYAVTQKADYIVDVATLTGACAVALGLHHSGLFSTHAKLSSQVLKASEVSGEPAWPMPMSPRYGEELKSQLADLSNMGKSREGGAQLGAKFLENFVGETPWVHLDIAGAVDLGEPAVAGAQVHAAGRMVHTFVTLAEQLSR